MAEKKEATNAQETVGTAEATKTVDNTNKSQKTARMREKRAFTATVVTFALTGLLIFMVVWTLVTGSEDKNGIIAGAMVIATSAIQFYFGTKQGGVNA